jgi:ATP-dependent Lon protease
MPSRDAGQDQAPDTTVDDVVEPTTDQPTDIPTKIEKTTTSRARKNTVKDVSEEIARMITEENEHSPEGDVDDEVPAARPRRRTRRKSQNDDHLLLPVIVTEETLLLPHMSIPFPLLDDDATLAVERAMRMNPRHVLMLTERRIPRNGGEEGLDPATRDFIDIMTDLIASGDEEGARRLAEENEGIEIDLEAEMAMDDDADYELCQWGVVAEVGQYITRPGGQNHVILNGVARGKVLDIIQEQPFIAARVERAVEPSHDPAETETAMGAMLEQVESYISMLPNVPEEVLEMVKAVDEPGWLADLIAFSPEFNGDQRQEMVETLDPLKRLHQLSVWIQRRLNVMNLRHEIQNEAQAGMDKQQREYFLREQLRAIQKELGEGSSEEALAHEIREKIEAAGMPAEVREKALIQVERLEQQHPFSPEIGVIRTYLEWLVDLPWSHETEDRLDLEETARILNEDHYGLEKVKDRIVEFIAVRKLAGDKHRSPILCFVGPPGVGKTSLGKSIARAIGREYVRMSLGGVRDEAEIRGHRRTYVGAMPGRVIKAMKDAGSRNPVIVLDEVDKVGSDTFRGDPSSALLEVLDPEQNTTFSDHYLEVPFDLSKAIFITTANMLDPIPPALRDRMEIIEVSGYTELEKLQIAKNYLLPKALESHGLSTEHLDVTDAALKALIREYTEESGVRNLEREIGALCRKVARKFAGANPPEHVIVEGKDVHDYLGVPRYEFGLAEEQDEVGVATGAAVTSVGGDLLSIEVTVMEGKGELILTGQLGDVMQESARAAWSYARAHREALGIDEGFFEKHNVHVHIPAGAIPKDGPSAGITMATALISALTGRKVRKDVAMTGEITLRGKVLPIGGLREKTLAAHRGGIKTFLLPKRNAKDLSELPDLVKSELELIQVDHLDEVLEVAFAPVSAKRRRKSSSGTPKGSPEAPGEEPGSDQPTGDRRKGRIDAPGGNEPLPASV